MQKALISKIRDATEHLHHHGYAIVRDFISPQTCEAAIQEIDRLIDHFKPTSENMTIFDATTGQSQHRFSKHFL